MKNVFKVSIYLINTCKYIKNKRLYDIGMDFNDPDDQINTFNNATVDVCKVGDQRVMRITAEPGWKWSNDVKPHVGTESCQTKHLGFIVKLLFV